jgi:hypothetical protein
MTKHRPGPRMALGNMRELFLAGPWTSPANDEA